MSLQPILLVIAGPTASGKTSTAIQLATRYSCPVISADSRQVYKETTIGTARATPEETGPVPYFLSGHLSIHQPYTAADFAEESRALLDRLFQQYPMVIVAGGSGLYLQALLYGLDPLPGGNESIRAALAEQLEKEGISSLQEKLKELDPEFFEQVDKNNPRRLIRALEVILVSGVKYSTLREGKKAALPWDVQIEIIDLPREELYSRINDRVDQMLAKGLEEEARALYPHRNLKALDTVGYKELFEWMDGDLTFSEAVEKIKKNTRNYAKRQLTWFRKMPDANWHSSGEILMGKVTRRIKF